MNKRALPRRLGVAKLTFFDCDHSDQSVGHANTVDLAREIGRRYNAHEDLVEAARGALNVLLNKYPYQQPEVMNLLTAALTRADEKGVVP